MSDEEVDAFLHERQTLDVATFNHDGSIHLVAMWYGFLEGDIVFETYARSQKVQNLRRDPRITCLVEDGDVYENLRGVELVGRGEVIDDHEVVLGAAASVVERYMGVDDPDEARAAAEVLANKRVAIRVRPERVVSWDHRKLGGTY